MAFIIIKYLHFIGIFVLFTTLVLEHTLLKKEMAPAQIKKIAFIDGLYAASALIVLLMGLLLWLMVGKPADFYTKNPVFHVKVTLFIVIALMSIYPTVFFLKQRKNNAATLTVPKPVIMIIRAELTLLLIVPLLAVMMAQGYGLSN